MIKNLTIRNYALIKGLEISPSRQLNVVTGETGAGKSILLGAVGLLLGNRADTKALLDKDEKCVIEGVFDVTDYHLKDLFDAEDLEYEDETIIRREISASGKSRAFINDTPVKLDTLSEIGAFLLDIHSQHDTLKIKAKSVQLKILDDYAGARDVLSQYQDAYRKFEAGQKKLVALEGQKAAHQKEADYNDFLLNELTTAALQEDEQEALENELSVLDNAEDIKLKLSQISSAFEEGNFPIQDQLSQLNGLLSSLSSVSKPLEDLSERFNSSLEELKDIVGDLAGIRESVDYDPQRIEEIKERLDLIYQLSQKHQVNTVADLLSIQNKLESKAEDLFGLDEEIELTRKQLEEQQLTMVRNAEALSEKRSEVLDDFGQKINELLRFVGIPDGKVEIAYKRIEPGASGIDEINILFSANKGVAPQPVQDVASGGEFSRLLFCIKYLLADKTALPTIIFDEIDTGVSGEIAKKLAKMMVKMAENHQVIAISHLPQIAAGGNAHYFVYKDNTSERTQSMVRQLDAKDRLEEIAKMIGGENPSEAALDNARELIAANSV